MTPSNQRNIDDRGLSFQRADDLDFETALFVEDKRRDYGETRIRALGMLDGRLHALVFTEIEDGIRVISFRRANDREIRRYESQTQECTDRRRQP
ncbi:MAG: BrnT family toxin [Casimicrobiaceae bacterium]